MKVDNFEKIQGLNSLWKISIFCRNEDVRNASRDLLCDMHLLYKSKTKNKIQDEFIR